MKRMEGGAARSKGLINKVFRISERKSMCRNVALAVCAAVDLSPLKRDFSEG